MTGKQLRDARLALGFTQREVAEATGVSQSYIWQIEHGRRGLGRELARGIVAMFGFDYDPMVMATINEIDRALAGYTEAQKTFITSILLEGKDAAART